MEMDIVTFGKMQMKKKMAIDLLSVITKVRYQLKHLILNWISCQKVMIQETDLDRLKKINKVEDVHSRHLF